MKRHQMIIATMVAGLACSVVTSQATITPLPLGGTVSPIAFDGTYGSVVGAEMSSGFSGTDSGGLSFSGTVNSWVYSGGSGALAGYQGDEFVYQVVMSSGSADSLEHLVVNGFGGIATAVAISSPVAIGYAAPNSVDRNGGPGSIAWDFTTTPVQGGMNSYYMIVYTDLTQFGTSGATVQDGTSINALPIYAPVPEPTTVLAGALMLLPLGIGAMRCLRKERAV